MVVLLCEHCLSTRRGALIYDSVTEAPILSGNYLSASIYLLPWAGPIRVGCLVPPFVFLSGGGGALLLLILNGLCLLSCSYPQPSCLLCIYYFTFELRLCLLD